MSNIFATSSIVAKASLPVLENMLGFSRYANRDYESEFTSNMTRGYAPGQTINIKRPPRYTWRAGKVATPQSTVQSTIPLTLTQGGTDLFSSSAERTLSLSRLDDILMAAMAPIANEIDRQGLALAHFSVANLVNPTGALPTTQAAALQVITDAQTKLDLNAAPRDRRRYLVTNPQMNGALVQGTAGLFNNQSTIGRQNDQGVVQDSYGLNYAMDQNVDVHTNGAATATNINGAGQTGSAITVVAVATGTLTAGTVITLPGVFGVNPQSRVTTGVLMDFVVTADAIAGATTINISPAIVTSGAFQNVTASPTTGAPYVIRGAASTSYATNVAYHKDAFTLAMVPMWTPQAGVISVAQETHNGFTIKVTDYYDGKNDDAIMRLDVLFGWAATYPELATKIYSV